MADPTLSAPPGPEEVVEKQRSKPNVMPDQVKQVVSALLVGCSWDANNRPVRARWVNVLGYPKDSSCESGREQKTTMKTLQSTAFYF